MIHTPSPESTDDDPAYSLSWGMPSPAKHELGGRTLADYHNILFDVCSLTVSLTSPGTKRAAAEYFQNFRSLLSMEGISHTPYEDDPELRRTTVRIATPMDMHRLMCKMPGRLQTVIRD